MSNTQYNEEIRKKIAKSGLKHYEIAYRLGITQYTFSKWLQLPLNHDREQRILDVIKK